MTWVALNVSTAVIVAAIIAYKLINYPERFNLSERLGMGAIGAGMFLRIGPILGTNVLETATPFDYWSVTLLHCGCAVYFIGRLLRNEAEVAAEEA